MNMSMSTLHQNQKTDNNKIWNIRVHTEVARYHRTENA